MSKYLVTIKQKYPLWRNMFPYEVSIYGPYDEHLKTDWSMSKWGARRLAKKMIKKIEGCEFKPKDIAVYEVDS
jgi:starvation-inducible outer membrane lipoprotein